MKQLALVLCAIVAVSNANTWKPGLRVRFDLGLLGIGSSHFINIPTTKSDANSAGWLNEPVPTHSLLQSVTMSCAPDRVICGLYDNNGYIAGMQIGLPVADFTPCYNMEENGFTEWTMSTGTRYYTIQKYFTTEELLSSRSTRREYENKLTENGGVWVTGVRKETKFIANNTAAIIADSDFVRQACIPWMGRHYYYRTTSEMSCTDEPLYPWFPIVDDGELIATGFIVCGTLDMRNKRNWFEAPNRTAVKAIVPNGPECLYNLAENPGFVTMHTYYVDQPWIVSCLFQ